MGKELPIRALTWVGLAALPGSDSAADLDRSVAIPAR
jgi:hypothetical protein